MNSLRKIRETAALPGAQLRARSQPDPCTQAPSLTLQPACVEEGDLLTLDKSTRPIAFHVVSAVAPTDSRDEVKGARPPATAIDPGATTANPATKKKKDKRIRQRDNKKLKEKLPSLLSDLREFELQLKSEPSATYLDSVHGRFSLSENPTGRPDHVKTDLCRAVLDEIWLKKHKEMPIDKLWEHHLEANHFASLLIDQHIQIKVQDLRSEGKPDDSPGEVLEFSAQDCNAMATKIEDAAVLSTSELKDHWKRMARQINGHLGRQGLRSAPTFIWSQAYAKDDLLRRTACAMLVERLTQALEISLLGETVEDVPNLPMPGSHHDVDRLLGRVMMCTLSSTAQLSGLLLAAHGDGAISRRIVEVASWLGVFGRDAAERDVLDTAAVALLISLSKEVLGKITITREELQRIRAHVFMLGGHIAERRSSQWAQRMNDNADLVASFSPERLIASGKAFLAEEDGLEVVSAMLDAIKPLEDNIRKAERMNDRIDELVRIEMRMQSLGIDFNFEDEPLDELLDAFVPIAPLALPNAPQMAALTYAEQQPDSEDKTAPHESTPVDYQALWESYASKNALRREETARLRQAARSPAAPLDADDEVSDRKQAPTASARGKASARGRQPGAKPRLAGYHHHSPFQRQRPKALSEQWWKEQLDACNASREGGLQFTDDHRRAAKARIAQAQRRTGAQTPEVVD